MKLDRRRIILILAALLGLAVVRYVFLNNSDEADPAPVAEQIPNPAVTEIEETAQQQETEQEPVTTDLFSSSTVTPSLDQMRRVIARSVNQPAPQAVSAPPENGEQEVPVSAAPQNVRSSPNRTSETVTARTIPTENNQNNRPASRTQAELTEQFASENLPVMALDLPSTINGQPSSPVQTETTISELQSVVPTDLAKAVAGLADDETIEQLNDLGDSPVSVSEIEAQTGIDLFLDPANLSVSATLPAAVARQERYSFASNRTIDPATLIMPSNFALGITTALIISDTFDDNRDARYSLFLDGFTNIGGIEGINIDFGATYFVGTNGEEDEFRRERIVAFKDDPERAMRYSLGDLFSDTARLAGTVDLLGISIERDYETLQPTRNIRPLGRSSFILERPSVVEVYANGILLESFSANPGPIEIEDLPLTDITNDIVIVVEDSFGRREVDQFSIARDFQLLDEGVSQFNVAAGVQRDTNFAEFDYTDDFVLTGTYTQGVTQNLTINANGAFSQDTNMLGGAAVFGALNGILAVDGAVSNDETIGTGFAVGLDYKGGPYAFGPKNDSLTIRADYFSEDFTTLSVFDFTSDTEYRGNLTYRFSAFENATVSIGGAYTQRRANDAINSNLFLGLNQPLGRFTFSAILRQINRSSDVADDDNETGAFLSLSRRIGDNYAGRVSYDTIREATNVEFNRFSKFNALPDLDYRISAEHTPDDFDIEGSATLTATRFTTDLDVTQSIGQNGAEDQTSARLRFQSGFAFTDGKVGIGRDPAQGFYMIKRHPSLSDSTVQVKRGVEGDVLASANWLGPAVTDTRRAYRTDQLAVTLQNAPPGYNVGEGQYTTLPGARSGFLIEVGSDAYRTVVATLEYLGEPFILISGSIRKEGSDERKTFFTNRSGRAVFNELEPGVYVGTIAGRNLQFRFVVEEGSEAYINLGSLIVRQGA